MMFDNVGALLTASDHWSSLFKPFELCYQRIQEQARFINLIFIQFLNFAGTKAPV
jgi:hypothetical protein